jgi:hypothetical protein
VAIPQKWEKKNLLNKIEKENPGHELRDCFTLLKIEYKNISLGIFIFFDSKIFSVVIPQTFIHNP